MDYSLYSGRIERCNYLSGTFEHLLTFNLFTLFFPETRELPTLLYGPAAQVDVRGGVARARGPVRACQVWGSSHSNLAGRAAYLSFSCYRAHIKCLTE
jgi:hypothetical protein